MVREIQSEPCPSCGEEYPVVPGYVSWCDHCLYNVNPLADEEKKTFMERAYLSLGERNGKALLDKMIQQKSEKPSLNVNDVMAYIFASLVHLVSLGLIFLAGYLLAVFYHEPILVITAVMLLGVAWVARPRINRLEKEDVVLERSQLPELFGVLDDISDGLHIKRIDGVVLDGQFNAAIGQVGLRKKVILRIGMPLFSIMTPEERLALLGHELGHLANGDLSRGGYIGTAMNTLATWYQVIHPGIPSEHDEVGVLEWISSFFLRGIAFFPKSGYYLLLYLLYFNSQQAEYYADYAGARVAGGEASKMVLEKLQYHDTYAYSVRKTALSNDKTDLYSFFTHQLDTMPQREKLRLKKINEMEKSKVDETHPPTHYRMNYLESKQMIDPLIEIDQERAERLDKELASYRKEIQETLVEEYRYYSGW
ncbi:M48 family metallopeptidase [Jeotgalibacillus proteolyticus]|uniref:Peptidase M48 domain-containing protein n=1 Tax=Jeotgalibacillus proteolyticus TaxID=2082395 RepID=A0A2S5GBS0_9BACL|nr:M48 family metallopeptidase [Jeotgalibacillus proteolyticus]PPA70361.1 hypothetical protein C4B60_12345 [Jeotgalibacillus proteolyticus]